MDLVSRGVDVVGVAVIVGGIVVASALAVTRRARYADATDLFRFYRQAVGRSMLLDLEFLVAADIIRTVAVSPTFQGVGVLAIIVLIRTFLSMALELELEGRWPWQPRHAEGNPTREPRPPAS